MLSQLTTELDVLCVPLIAVARALNVPVPLPKVHWQTGAFVPSVPAKVSVTVPELEGAVPAVTVMVPTKSLSPVSTVFVGLEPVPVEATVGAVPAATKLPKWSIWRLMDSVPALAVPIWILPELVALSFLAVMKALRDEDFGIPLQFTNYRP